MHVVYVIGPYRAPSEWEVVSNIRRAELVAIDVWKLGAACICPHKNTALLGGACEDEVWLQGDLEILSRCDASLVLDGWESSQGSKGEILFCENNGIPVFYNLKSLDSWMKSNSHGSGVDEKETNTR